MKKLLIITLILSLAGCKRENVVNYTIENENLKDEEVYVPKTIVKNYNGSMDNQLYGEYVLIYDDEITFEVNKRYLVDMGALRFDFPLNVVNYEGCHLSGEYRYTYKGDNYIVKLNEIRIGHFYNAEEGGNFFHLVVEDNEIRYWLYSKGKAELVINKIWRFVPNE